MLLEAFEELASEKSMESISVSEICERSTVRRNTFYRHFSDKYAFIQFYLQSLADRFMAESECDMDDIRDYAQHMHRALIRFVQTHQNSMKYALGDTTSVGMIDLIIRQIAEGINLRAARGLEGVEHPALELQGMEHAALELEGREHAGLKLDGMKHAAQELDGMEHHAKMPVEFLGYFYSAGMVHTLRWWFFEEKPVAPELLEQYCTAFLMRCYTEFTEP